MSNAAPGSIGHTGFRCALTVKSETNEVNP
jgi:hypothetical protein